MIPRIMRGTSTLVTLGLALAACHSTAAPAPVAPQRPAACARASDSLVAAMLARLPPKATPPTEEADALRNLIRDRCEQDRWSADATRCLTAIQRLEDAEPCAKLMTEAQQAALVRDQQARSGPASPEPAQNADRKRPPSAPEDAR